MQIVDKTAEIITASQLAAVLANDPHRKELNCSGQTAITDADMDLIAKLTGLQLLILDGTGVTDAGIAHLVKLPNLGRLQLRGTKITDAAAPAIAKLGRLKVLDLGWTGITDAGMQQFAGLGLCDLAVDGTKITDYSLRNVISGFPRLTDLYIGHTSVTDEGVLHLSKLVELQCLDLGNTQITDVGVENLCRCNPRKLWELSLKNTAVTDAGVLKLRSLQDLRWLYLQGTKITNAVMTVGNFEDWFLEIIYVSNTGVTPEGVTDLITNGDVEVEFEADEEEPIESV